MAKKDKDSALSDIAKLHQLGFSNRFIEGLLRLLGKAIHTETQTEVDWLLGINTECNRLKLIIEEDMRNNQHMVESGNK